MLLKCPGPWRAFVKRDPVHMTKSNVLHPNNSAFVEVTSFPGQTSH